MRRRSALRWPRLTYANVMATAAVFLALAGSAVAISSINGAQIRDRSIPGDKLKRNDVTGQEVKEQSLKGVVKSCQAGALHGFVRVIASASFPSTYTADPTFVDPELTFNCTGGQVLARRESTGVYDVRFEPSIGALAFGNGEGNNLISTRVITDAGKPAFRVEVRDPTTVADPVADTPFSLLIP